VKAVYLDELYDGTRCFNAYGPAVVVLKKRISFSYYVAPVCIDWNGKYNVANGDLGKVGL